MKVIRNYFYFYFELIEVDLIGLPNLVLSQSDLYFLIQCFKVAVTLHWAKLNFEKEILFTFKSGFGYWQVLHFKKITYISSPSNLIRPRVGTHITFKIDVISLLNIWSVERESETEDGLRNIYNQVILDFLHHHDLSFIAKYFVKNA